MREIKFRGYNAKNKEWLYGCYLINRGEHFICPDGIQPADKTSEDFQIELEMLGQFTGLYDKHGKEICEGDIIECTFDCEGIANYGILVYPGMKYVGVVMYDDGVFIVQNTMHNETRLLLSDYEKSGCEIIGNIHDNPELLKGGEE